jgi:hypothetical protein
LLLLFNQYQAFFEEMGGFLSFMMPSPKGLVFHFDTAVNFPKELQNLLDKNGEVALSQKWLMQEQGLDLPSKPIRVTAIVDK